jgi:tagatose 1,6-diphosphate aldolase GatY/KbaY
MLTSTRDLLHAAQKDGYALGAFNVYNLEGVLAVMAAAEREQSPVLLQMHPTAIEFGGPALVALCVAAASEARVPAGVHLDHATSEGEIQKALDAGLLSIMADGSHLPYAENVEFCSRMVDRAHRADAVVEVELGRLSGTEDGLTVPERLSKLTDPKQAAEFIDQTGADFLAVCIGNVHGHYRGEPDLDLERLAEIRRCVGVPLVLHGASGLPAGIIRRTIGLGVCKFNVNTEVREAYLSSLAAGLGSAKKLDLVALMKRAVSLMESIVAAKLREFGSSGKSRTHHLIGECYENMEKLDRR